MPTYLTSILSCNGHVQMEMDMISDNTTGKTIVKDIRKHVDSSIEIGEATNVLMQQLGKRMRIELSDERIIIGTFYCLDEHQNILLAEAREYIKEQALLSLNLEELYFSTNGRGLGMVLVPGAHIVTVHIYE